jgi:hypothetical protein
MRTLVVETWDVGGPGVKRSKYADRIFKIHTSNALLAVLIHALGCWYMGVLGASGEKREH